VHSLYRVHEVNTKMSSLCAYFISETTQQILMKFRSTLKTVKSHCYILCQFNRAPTLYEAQFKLYRSCQKKKVCQIKTLHDMNIKIFLSLQKNL
jgi:hypothetical protein